ncbi:MAG TPA: hypothetical protein VGM82_09745 [Gemmatimonadaceae bacterium]|jgi:hypothetical protein
MGHAGPQWAGLACSHGRKYVFTVFAPFTLIPIVMLLVGGPEQRGRSGTLRVDLLCITYPLGAFVAGCIVGLFLPATRRLWAALPIGVAAMLPWAIGICFSFDAGYSHWASGHTFSTAVTSIILGGALGYGVHAASAAVVE